MSGPANINPRALVRSLDDMMSQGGQGWDALEAHFQPARVSDQFRPDDVLLKELGALSQHDFGRRLLAWLFDLTIRAPYPRQTGTDFEAAGLAAAKHEGRAAVGEVLLEAVVEGRKLIDNEREPNP